uniref:Uncharacterized protein LOC111134744 isoform X2 n=1 Tax=Crassostrea virginica TaxID=6565 RepID=A0A8B8EJH7_CRAVI|nr:uncharacterized protein LOC111134744 isoform X2 [Crassostrea virginica]
MYQQNLQHLHPDLRTVFKSMGVLPTGEWKFLFLDNGVQYATIAGITKMLKLCVVCWDTVVEQQGKKHIMAKGVEIFGLMMSTVLVLRSLF